MLTLDEVVQRLVYHEGVKLKPYKDTKGKLTIGVGRCIETNPFTYEELKAVGDWEKGITKNAAFFLLRNDIRRVSKECKSNIPFYEELNDGRRYALLDMCFQLGIGGLLGFKKMLAAMSVGNWIEAKEQCLDSKYAREDSPKRAERIARTIETGVFKI